MIAREQYIGSLEAGKLADAIVLDNNLFEQSVETVYRTKVLRTLVGGKVVYQA
ncbi:hypothetical protein D3C84_1195910 [compost metagenome]